VAGVFLITPWNNLPDLAQKLYWMVPARWLIRDRYDSAANLAKYAGPVAMLVAEEDSLIPPAHSLALFDSLREPKFRMMAPGADHNTWPLNAGSDWAENVMRFLSSHAAPAGQCAGRGWASSSRRWHWPPGCAS
jgi:hypothetical protein